MRQLFCALIFTLLTTACGGSGHGKSTDPNAATGFMTENPVPPQGAKDCSSGSLKCDRDGRPYGYALLGKQLPEFSGTLTNGTTFDSTAVRNWTIIDVWGIWCGDCIADAPFVAELAANAAADPSLSFMSIHTPASPDRTDPDDMFGKYGSLETYFTSKGYSYPTLIDDTAEIRQLLEIRWTPSYLLVAPGGKVVGFRTDLSVSGDRPVDAFLNDIAMIRETYEDAAQLQIGPDHAGFIRGQTPFTLTALERAFPDRDVVFSRTSKVDSGRYAIFDREAAGEGEPIYTIEPSFTQGYVGQISTRSTSVEGPNGLTVGQSTLGEYLQLGPQNCEEMSEQNRSGFVCKDNHLTLIFGPSVLTKTESASALPLTEMRFTPAKSQR